MAEQRQCKCETGAKTDSKVDNIPQKRAGYVVEGVVDNVHLERDGLILTVTIRVAFYQ